jgi:hypothetical protein
LSTTLARSGNTRLRGAVVNPALISIPGAGPIDIEVVGEDLFLASNTINGPVIGKYTISGATVNPALISRLNNQPSDSYIGRPDAELSFSTPLDTAATASINNTEPCSPFVISTEVENTACRDAAEMDCIAHLGNGRASRESASQISYYFGLWHASTVAGSILSRTAIIPLFT